MIKKRQKISWIIVLCFCLSMLGEAGSGKAEQKTISITEFYNNGVFGEGYEKALAGTVVTISNAEEMHTFFRCLDHQSWTEGICFRQEADISFSDCTFSYDQEKERIGIYQGNTLLGAADRNGTIFRNYVSSIATSIQQLGLGDAYIERQMQVFAGEYDGQGHSVSGFILSGSDTMHNGIFGYLAKQSSVYDLNIQDCFLLNACGTFCGLNSGTLKDCSAKRIVGLGWWLGGIAESNDGTMLRCKLDHGTLVSSIGFTALGLRMGGIAGSIYLGKISDCAVEHSQIFAYDRVNTYAGGIVGYQNMGQVSSCSNFGNCSIPERGENYIAGGIVGFIESYEKSEIYNCVSAGEIVGGVVGGLVGMTAQKQDHVSATSELIENCVSFSKVRGYVTGSLVGEMEEGCLVSCYYNTSTEKNNAVGRNVSGTQQECYGVNQAQIYGKDSAGVIGGGSQYGNTTKLLDALNSWVAWGGGFLKWKAGVLGYPVLVSGLYEAPTGDFALEIGEDTSSSEIPSLPDTPTDSDSPSSDETEEKPGTLADTEQLELKSLKVVSTSSLQVKISWNQNKYAKGYEILRSAKKSSGYKKIGNVSSLKVSYIDKKVKRGQIYYYMVRAYDRNNVKKVYGKTSKKKIKLAWYEAPILRLSKGVTPDRKSYVQVGVNRYSGSYVEVYLKTNGKRYVKAPLKNKKISFYNGKIRFSYQRKTVLYCKIRTYQIKKGKKYYSSFSKEKRIRL